MSNIEEQIEDIAKRQLSDIKAKYKQKTERSLHHESEYDL